MADIVWLASYPKSGNTWLRVLLANYLGEGQAPVDINELSGGPIASARLWFDEWAGLEASELDDETIDELRPGVYRCMARAASKRLYMKVHDAWQRTVGGGALFPADVTAGVVYVLRNPLDLVASLANHSGATLARAAEVLCNPDDALGRTHTGLSDQLRQFMGGWTHHATSWIDDSGLPVHVVRYEDLRADPEPQFAAIVRFCGLACDPARVAQAVAFSSFGELQRQEQSVGFRERLPVTTGLFFRRGQVGGWRDELPPALAQKVVAAHGSAMRRFGYLDDEGQPQ